MNWRNRKDEELDEEIRAHLAMAERDRRERGESPREAAANARREFGNEALVKEVTREMWGWVRAERWAQDLGYGLRVLRAQPVFALTAVLSLAIGIGANIAAFSIADAMLLRPLAVRDPAKLMAVHGVTPLDGFERISYAGFREIREGCRSCEGVVAHRMFRFSVARPQDPVPQVRMGMQVSDGFFEVLGIQPRIGRGFSADESTVPGRDPVVVLSYSYWQQEMGGDPAVLGRTVRLNGIPFSVVGVMPEEFTGMDAFLRPAMYVPMTMTSRLFPGRGAEFFESRELRDLLVKARLKPGVGRERAQAELRAVAAAQAERDRVGSGRRTLQLRTELESRLEEAPANKALVAMLGLLSALVLCVACANVAGLLLARAQARQREIAVRLAIGAGRARLFQQLVAESLLLGAAGGLAGCGLAYGAVRWLAAIQIPTDTPIVLGTRLDERALVFAGLVCLVAVVAFGLVPAWRTVQGQPGSALQSREVAEGGRLRLRGRNLLVGAQVAVSLVLLVISGAMVDAFGKMMVADPGIRTDHVMMMEFDPSLVQYDGARTVAFYRQLKDRVAGLAGVRGVTMARGIPFRPNFTDEPLIPEGYDLPKEQPYVKVAGNMVDEDYFRVMKTPLVAGRGIERSDVRDGAMVAVVNEEFARRYWPGGRAVGRRFRLVESGQWVEVVGVARTAKYLSLMEAPTPYFYLSLAQVTQNRVTLLVETEGPPQNITSALLAAVRDLDPNQPVYNVRPLDSFYAQGVLGLARVVLQMVSAMGIAGMLLALVGLYGLVSYSVSRRTREIGIRMAVGAGRATVLRMVLRQGLVLGVSGAAFGLLASVPLFRVLRAGFSGLGILSAWTLIAVPLLLAALTAAACLPPARRASRIDPTQALRFD